MKKVFLLITLFLLGIGQSHGLTVVTTTSHLGDAVDNILGSSGKAIRLMGPQVDPHLYRPTRGDMVSLLQADVIIYNGLSLEGGMEGLLERLGRGKVVKAVGEALSKTLRDPVKAFDPHIWMDVALWDEVVEIIAQTLIESDPDNAALYRRNADIYRLSLADLQTRVKETLASIPRERRILVTAHDAFRYFGQAYDFQVIGIQGISTESEAGLKRIEEIVTLVVEKKIQAIFIETSVSDRHVRALIEGAKRQGREVRIGGSLFSDSLGREESREGTYIGMMLHNATTISRALSSLSSL